MSILSTNKKIIKVQGTEYSAGEGIIIEDNVISVDMSAVGQNYSAGPNIDIYKEDEQAYISGRDWTDLIKEASANAYDSATGAIPEPQDLTYMSGAIDYVSGATNYVSGEVSNASSYSYSQATGYYNTWITGQYEGDITNITNNISSLSSSLSDDYYKKTETSSKGEIDDALQYISANAGKTYEGVSPIVVNNTEDKISAVTWVLSGGNNVTLVDDNINKVTRIDVEVPTPFDPTYMSGQIDNKLDSSSFVPSDFYPMTGNPSGFLTEHQSLAGYATEQWVEDKGYITGVDLTPYQPKSGMIDYQEKSGMVDYQTTAGMTAYATTSDVANLAQTISETYQVKGDYLTTADSDNFYPANNPSGFITGVDLSNYYTKSETSGADQLAEAFNNIPHGDEEVNDVVHTYSADGTWLVANDITGLQEKGDYYSASNPSGFLVPNDISNLASISLVEETSGSIVNLIPDTSNFITNLSAETTYQTIEGMVDYAKSSALDNLTNDYTTLSSNINLNSATWNDVASTYQTNSGTYLTAHQSLADYATTSELNSTSSYLSGAIDYVSANAGSTLPSAFEVDEDGQAYKVSAYTSAMNPTSTAFSDDITEFPISEIGAYVYTTNISNGRWQLDGGEGANISDNTIDLTNVSESTWEYSTKLTVQDYSWPAQVATLSTTAEIVDRTPYLLSGQGGGITGDYVSGYNIVSGASGPFGQQCTATEISGDVTVSVWRSNIPGTATYSLLDIGRSVTTIKSSSASWNEVSNKVDLSAYNELKSSYDALSSLFATYSGQWLLPNTGV